MPGEKAERLYVELKLGGVRSGRLHALIMPESARVCGGGTSNGRGANYCGPQVAGWLRRDVSEAFRQFQVLGVGSHALRLSSDLSMPMWVARSTGESASRPG